MPNLLLFAVLTWTLCIPQVNGIVGYDCGSTHLNVTTLSLLDVESCDIPLTQPQIEKTYIQLLQLSKFESIEVIQCKVSINRFIYYCGMHSHLSTVRNAQAEYILEITAEQCKKMHLTGIFSFDIHNYIYGLKVNQTTMRPTIFAGSANSDGRCSGAQYSDLYGAWDNVIVQGTTTITLTSYQTSINLETNQIRLKSGTICPYTDATCMDIDGGHTFWKTLPTDHCKFNHYDVLYEGYANRMVDTFFEHPQIVYSLSTQDITFALTRTGEEPVCGYTLIKTEHPKLLILETKKGESFTTKRRLSTENLDIFTYINSKFVYVEKHIRSQMNLLYRDVLKQRCTLEQQVLKGALSLAINSPDEFAYQIMKGPGYMAVISGEVVHIIKCTPVDVKIQHVKECYSELPVQKGNETYFLSPRTHILIKTGTQISCNRVIPPMFFLNDGWYRMTPTPEHSLPPTIMKPMTKPTWHYTNPGSLAASGIYSDTDLENLRDHIMFPAEKGGILNAMARGVKGEPIVSQGISLSHLLDESSIQKITENTWKKIWGNFISFGNASAGIIGIYFCIRTVKLIIDTIIHGYAIHTIYGWSLHLIGALWDSVTNLIIHLSQKPKRKEAFQEEAAEKLTTSEENPNLPKDTTNQERSTEISIEQKDILRIYPQL
ncbi:hypothetical protein ALC57_08270 [Trachymyrmex cornetzi]|uniref:Glycoprotein n=1 Tax=Trachymyrmex cornetzi TaxID=471704 RepID=A0A151J7N2_9HYME|nr:hypothetical protein ALC57_08270 [Trachymyrmex cornetzi]